MNFEDFIEAHQLADEIASDLRELSEYANMYDFCQIAADLEFYTIGEYWEQFGNYYFCVFSPFPEEYAQCQITQEGENLRLTVAMPFDERGIATGPARIVLTVGPEWVELLRFDLPDALGLCLHDRVAHVIQEFVRDTDMGDWLKFSSDLTQRLEHRRVFRTADGGWDSCRIPTERRSGNVVRLAN